ncbi:hypothetical protein CK203_066390 [Vitis vinifera]|uniref:MULE transposase domain-containing protein n=1 Tax=Vitis vinifera TaxID=29760 RepID=A0A438G226_VITVI|nr:hypothetical protein CK203_066390 [Vitis vinifera]
MSKKVNQSESIVPVICFCKGKILRTETYVKYIRDLAVIVPLDVPVSSTYEHLLSMIYSRIGIDKKQFQLILNYRYPLKWKIEQMKKKKNVNPKKVMIKARKQKMFNMMVMGVFEFIDEENNNVNVVSSFLALHEAMESEQRRYVSVDRECCDMLNNPDFEDPIEFSLVQYHSAPSLQFENVENIGNVVSSDWTPWGNTNIGNSGGEFMVGQVFNSKADLQHAVKLYSISAHQDSDGTHLYGKYKDTLRIAMGCDGNNQLFPLAFAITEDRHLGIMVAISDVHLGWSEPYAYHRVCMRHLDNNFMTRFKDKILKNLMCRAALTTKIKKFNKHMNTIGRINAAAQQWLEVIPFEKWVLSHDRGRRYDIMTTNMSEVFNSVLKWARSLPVTTLVQLTFFRLNSYFVVRRKQCANRLASNEEYTPYVDAKIKANVVKARSHEIVLYDHIQGHSM